MRFLAGPFGTRGGVCRVQAIFSIAPSPAVIKSTHDSLEYHHRRRACGDRPLCARRACRKLYLHRRARVALDPVTGQAVPGGITEQTARVFENLKAILEAAGSSLGQVVKATVFLKDMNDFAAMNAVYASYFGTDSETLPARTTVEVARLPRNLLVEIEVVAEV